MTKLYGEISKRGVLLFLAISLMLFSAGCPLKAPIHKPSTNVNPGDLQFSPEQLNLLIQSGVTAAGWQPISNRPGEILAELRSREHRVVVAIRYKQNLYEITHRESTPGLKYNSQTQVIHKKYNAWVEELDRIIQTEITRYFVGQMAQLSSQSPEEAPKATEQPVPSVDGGPTHEEGIETPLSDPNP